MEGKEKIEETKKSNSMFSDKVDKLAALVNMIAAVARKNAKKTILYSTVLLIVIVGFIVFKNNEDVPSQPAAIINKTSVQIQPAKAIEKELIISSKATIEPCEEGIVSSKLSGQVVRILFENGDAVEQGQALVLLEDQDLHSQLQTAEITVQKMEATLESSQQNYDRAKALFDNGAIAKADYDAAVTSLKLDQANLKSAQVTFQSVNHSLESCVIRAPISGVLDNKSVKLGQMISPDLMLAQVKNISSVYAVLQIEQQNVNIIKLGQKAIITDNDTTLEGVVKSINVSADPSSRVFNCKVQVDNQSKLLHPGDYARVEITTDQKIPMITVPIEALAGDEGNYFIFINNNGIARQRSVTIGQTIKNLVEIKSGVQNGDSIICTNVNTLQDGDGVIVFSEQGGI
jgi:RND family efflux transporter MFP subunit